MTVLGQGEFAFTADSAWGQLPEGWRLGDVAGIAVDSADRVYVLHRGRHPMLVFDRDGQLLDCWGDELFTRPHGLHVAADGSLYCTDDGDHSVRRCTPDGRVLAVFGTPGRPAAAHSGQPFNRCTHTATAADGSLFVTDGYGNARVHKYDPDGRLVLSWGREGTAAGEFNVPHNIVCDPAGLVYVADRENHRIQVFDGQGRLQGLFGEGLHRPSGLCLAATGPSGAARFYVGEIGPYLSANRGWPHLGPRLSVLDTDGRLLARLASEPAAGPDAGQFVSPHGIAVDSHGDVYVADVCFTGWPSLFPGVPVPERLRGLQKLTRTPADEQEPKEAVA